MSGAVHRNWIDLRLRTDDTGDEEPLEVTNLNALPVKLVDQNGNVLNVDTGIPTAAFEYLNITGTVTTTVKIGAGVLHSLTFGKPIATGVITIYDNNTAAAPIISTITIPASPMQTYFLFDVKFYRGLVIVVGTAAQDITVAYR